MATDINALAEQTQIQAHSIIKETKVLDVWAASGFEVELVGSLRMGLMMRNLDIDMHVYSNPFSLEAGFEAITHLALNPRILRIEYKNLLDAEDQCLEWHAWYEATNGETWQLDMIQIHSESPYAGYFERVADAIKAKLTPESRQAILKIKYSIPKNQKVMSIEVYQAVLRDGVRDCAEFMEWKKRTQPQEVIEWMP